MKMKKYVKNGGGANKVSALEIASKEGKILFRKAMYFNIAACLLLNVNYSFSNHSWGDKANVVLGFTSIGLCASKNKYAVTAGLAIGIYDLFGGFNGFYNELDKQEKLYNAGYPVVIGLYPSGTPIMIQKGDKE